MSSNGSPNAADADLGDQQSTVEQAQMQSILNRIGHAWWIVLILGLVSLLAGILVFMHPFGAIRVAAVILGVWLLVSGVFQLVQSFDRGMESVARVLSAVSGVIGIVLGIICFDSVEDRIALLTLFVGIWWIIRGVMQLVVGSSAEGGNGLLVFVGLVGILAGIVVLVWPIVTLTVLAVVVGLWLMVLGVLEVIASLRVRSLKNRAGAGIPE